MTSLSVAYFDCFSGASGDMLLGALLDAGLSIDDLRAELGKLPLAGYEIRAERRLQRGLSGTKLSVILNEAEQHHRHLDDITAILASAGLPPSDVARGLAIFRRLGRAEAKVHGTTIDEVHFHEVGAVDSIVDIVGFVIGIRLLGIERIFSSPLSLGSGWIKSAHGLLPVPVPATLEILSEAGVPTRPTEAQTELVTPTGAAILSELAEFRQPPLRLRKIGYGLGSKELPWLNAVRVWLGEIAGDGSPGQEESVVVLECNIDDMTGEALGYALERLFEAGALDAWFTPIQMKKNRPAVKLSVLARPEDGERLGRLLLEETSTLGVRSLAWGRQVAGRQSLTVETPWGTARAKVKLLDGRPAGVAPEYEDCARLAHAAGVPLARVYAAVVAACGIE